MSQQLLNTNIETSDNYYIDGQEGYIAPAQTFSNENYHVNGEQTINIYNQVERIYAGMNAMFVVPTLKIVRPTYTEKTSTMIGKTKMPENFGSSLKQSIVEKMTFGENNYWYQSIGIAGHGGHVENNDYLKYKSFNYYTNFGVRERINIGDYVYLREEQKLYIFRCEKNEVAEFASGSFNKYAETLQQQGLYYDLYTRSCYVDEYFEDEGKIYGPGIVNAYTLVAVISLA